MTLHRRASPALLLILIAAFVTTTAAPAPVGGQSLARQIAASLERVRHDVRRISARDLAVKRRDGRFAIETDEPHVKVAWRIRGRRPTGHRRNEPQREGETS